MLHGHSIVNGKSHKGNGATFAVFDPATGESLDPPYHYASIDDLNQAADLAVQAFVSYANVPGKQKGHFLRHIATGLEAIEAELVSRAHRETALGEPRLKGELARTANQLRLFAQLVEEGSWVNARIDPAQPGRKPLPRADIRSMLRPLGPVAVFGASNFPLAFSVAGGDTASALAGGNPVIVKAHSAHPGTSELVGHVICDSVREADLHPGVFALLFGEGNGFGGELVKHPNIKAVGFTGSGSGGRELMKMCAARPEPIPCFTEMSSANPVFVLPEALLTRNEQIAAGLFASFTLGVGQFCTKPGLVFLPRNEEGDALVARLKMLVEQSGSSPMLNEDISNRYHAAVADRRRHRAISALAHAGAPGNVRNTYALPVLLEIGGRDLLRHPELAGEVFGPCALVIRFESREEMLALARSLEGQLTATLHGTEGDLLDHPDLLGILEHKAGRIIVNGFPTGVEVCHAMIHGGPFPATSDSRFTSVGTQAIYRFVRPVCFQDFPQVALPEELRDENPLGIVRLLDGVYTRDAMGQKPHMLEGAHAFEKLD